MYFVKLLVFTSCCLSVAIGTGIGFTVKTRFGTPVQLTAQIDFNQVSPRDPHHSQCVSPIDRPSQSDLTITINGTEQHYQVNNSESSCYQHDYSKSWMHFGSFTSFMITRTYDAEIIKLDLRCVPDHYVHTNGFNFSNSVQLQWRLVSSSSQHAWYKKYGNQTKERINSWDTTWNSTISCTPQTPGVTTELTTNSDMTTPKPTSKPTTTPKTTSKPTTALKTTSTTTYGISTTSPLTTTVSTTPATTGNPQTLTKSPTTPQTVAKSTRIAQVMTIFTTRKPTTITNLQTTKFTTTRRNIPSTQTTIKPTTTSSTTNRPTTIMDTTTKPQLTPAINFTETTRKQTLVPSTMANTTTLLSIRSSTSNPTTTTKSSTPANTATTARRSIASVSASNKIISSTTNSSRTDVPTDSTVGETATSNEQFQPIINTATTKSEGKATPSQFGSSALGSHQLVYFIPSIIGGLILIALIIIIVLIITKRRNKKYNKPLLCCFVSKPAGRSSTQEYEELDVTYDTIDEKVMLPKLHTPNQNLYSYRNPAEDEYMNNQFANSPPSSPPLAVKTVADDYINHRFENSPSPSPPLTVKTVDDL